MAPDLTKNLKASTELNSVCKNLFKASGLNYFSYGRLYRNRDYEFVMSNSDIFEYFLKNKSYLTLIAAKHFDYYSTGFIYNTCRAASEAESQLMVTLRKNFGLGHIIGYHQISADRTYCDFFIFGADYKNLHINQFYLANLPLLKKYSQLILPYARRLIAENGIEKNNVPYLPDQFDRAGLNTQFDNTLPILIDLVYKRNSNVYALHKNPVTSRELDCLVLLLKSNTAKEAAKILGISHRTMEHHYNRLKLKLDVSSKKEIKGLFEYE